MTELNPGQSETIAVLRKSLSEVTKALDYIVRHRLILGAGGEFLERDTPPTIGYGGFCEHEQMAYVQQPLAAAIARLMLTEAHHK